MLKEWLGWVEAGVGQKDQVQVRFFDASGAQACLEQSALYLSIPAFLLRNDSMNAVSSLPSSVRRSKEPPRIRATKLEETMKPKSKSILSLNYTP